MSKDNPFIGRGAPVSGERLVGRQVLLNRLIERVRYGAHCSIVGLPRMGKTSVAKEILRTLAGKSSELTVGYMTLDAIRGPIQAYSRIFEEISPDTFSDQSIARCKEHDEAYERFLCNLRRWHRSGGRSVIVLDELDAIVRDGFSDAQLFVSRIREMANDRERYGITFIFISRRSLDMIQGVVDCSTLAGLCEVVYLQPLAREYLDNLAIRSPVPIDNAGREALWQITGGHPFLAEVVMCEAVEMGHPHLNNASIESAQYAQSHEFTNQYHQLASLLSHGEMFEALCELVVGPKWRPIEPHTICLFKHYGVVRSSDEAAGGVECISQHFRDYLALLTRTTPSWVLLGDAERQLRILVLDRMFDLCGENWFEDLQKKHPKLSVALERLVDQKVREKRMFGDAASDFILDYAYIGDLKDLIFAEWERFRSVFGGAKSDWERRFQDIMKIRNPMAHHRPVPADVLQEAERSCKALISRFKGE
ncbi:MAG: AAA family ATPase [Lamprobacter sp.]|uniref:AAA family ATPase n=1 Tax=Lamprobacter sp. TaxID=3100796 RepID=UPI002B261865|nr:AAA family ATPase [Lamprobacter sp.]MEA3641648.1 AAA family ATPase [Lamprobacter sp.]